MNRKASSMPIETLGKIILAVLVGVAVIIFIVSGVTTQAGAFNQTGTGLIGNLSDKAQGSGGLLIK